MRLKLSSQNPIFAQQSERGVGVSRGVVVGMEVEVVEVVVVVVVAVAAPVGVYAAARPFFLVCIFSGDEKPEREGRGACTVHTMSMNAAIWAQWVFFFWCLRR